MLSVSSFHLNTSSRAGGDSMHPSRVRKRAARAPAEWACEAVRSMHMRAKSWHDPLHQTCHVWLHRATICCTSHVVLARPPTRSRRRRGRAWEGHLFFRDPPDPPCYPSWGPTSRACSLGRCASRHCSCCSPALCMPGSSLLCMYAGTLRVSPLLVLVACAVHARTPPSTHVRWDAARRATARAVRLRRAC